MEGWQSLAAVLGQGLKVWEVWRIRTRRSLAASIQGQSKLQPLAHVQSKLQPLAPVVKHSDPPSLPPRLQPIRLFQLLLPPSPLPHLQPVLSLLAPKLTSLDISAQSNTLKLFQPQLKQFSKLTSLRWGGGRVYG